MLGYHDLVRRRAEGAFRRASAGDWDPLLRGTRPDVHRVFLGNHALGGERHTLDGLRAWTSRFSGLFPVHRFAVHEVAVRGGLGDTRVAVRWTAELVPRAGAPYGNEGTTWLAIRWGRIAAIREHTDSQAVAAACEAMAAAGIDEAAAAPIADPVQPEC